MVIVTLNDFNAAEIEDANEIMTFKNFLHVRNNGKLVAIFNDWLYVEIVEDLD